MSTTTETVECYGIDWEIEVYRGSAAMDDPSECRLLGATWSTSWHEYGEECGDGDAPWWVAAVPVLALVAVTLGVLYQSGRAKVKGPARLFEILAQADGYGAILMGALVSVILAVALSMATKSLDLEGCTEAAVAGMKVMFEALIILVLAWALSSAMKELNAAGFMVKVLKDSVPLWSLPTLVFLIGAGISFAVGSSYTTMGVLMPIVLPLAFKLARLFDMPIEEIFDDGQ